MSTFQPNEVTDITLTGARIQRVTTEGVDGDVTRVAQIAVYNDQGMPYYVTVPLGWASVTVERRTPAEWPPRAGDLWRNRAEPFFAVDVADTDEGPSEVLLVTTVGEQIGPDAAWGLYGPLTLVHREDDGEVSEP